MVIVTVTVRVTVEVTTAVCMYCRDVGLAVLQDNLGHTSVPSSQIFALLEGCQQQPCLVRIAGRALAQGCITVQDITGHTSGEAQLGCIVLQAQDGQFTQKLLTLTFSAFLQFSCTGCFAA